MVICKATGADLDPTLYESQQYWLAHNYNDLGVDSHEDIYSYLR